MMEQFGTQKSRNTPTRREFLAITASAAFGMVAAGCVSEEGPGPSTHEPVIDIHQHTNYAGRIDADLIAHQRKMGVTHTVLLPAGRYFGLEVNAGGNETVVRVVRQLPREFSFFANEVPFIEEAPAEIKKFLRRGGIGIGEQKFQIDCDSPSFERMAALAAEFHVPILAHFQYERYNTRFEHFYQVLDKYPRVNFIGHAQTWWANIDRNHKQEQLYPRTRVTAGGLTDRWLADYPNLFADMSAGSGLNSMTRDEEHAREFLKRHQDKLLFGSDCNDKVGEGTRCQGAQILAAIRKLAPSKDIERKILHGNAKKLLRLPAFA